MAYTPIPKDKLYDYGELPEMSGDSTIFELSKSNIPSTAKEVLVYLWATTKGDKMFHRFYYQIFTKDGKQMYSQYMNVAASQDTSLNSANLWLPVFPGNGQVTVTLVDAENFDAKGQSIACRCHKKTGKGSKGNTTFSEFFVLGFR